MSAPPGPSVPPLPNTYWVIPGRFLAGEYPGGEDEESTRRRLNRLHDAGINYFLDLTEENELTPYRQFLPAETKYLRHPIPDEEVPSAITHLWQQSERSKSWPTVPQTSVQAAYIRRWPVHRKFHNRKVEV